MKPLYWVLIAVGVIIVGYFIFKPKPTVQQPIQSTPDLTPGGTSNAASLITALFPYFKQVTTKSSTTQVTPKEEFPDLQIKDQNGNFIN